MTTELLTRFGVRFVKNRSERIEQIDHQFYSKYSQSVDFDPRVAVHRWYIGGELARRPHIQPYSPH